MNLPEKHELVPFKMDKSEIAHLKKHHLPQHLPIMFNYIHPNQMMSDSDSESEEMVFELNNHESDPE